MLWKVGGESRKIIIKIIFSLCYSLIYRESCILRLAYRDIGGSDPERMAAPRVAEYVQELFKDSPVEVVRNFTYMLDKRFT